MINAKQVYGTYPHVQMRFHIGQLMGNESAGKKAAALGRLVGKYIYNCNDQEEERDYVENNIDASFTWDDTPEGHDFWSEVHRHKIPAEFEDAWLKRVVPRRAKVIKPAVLKKRVGWWV